VREERRTKRRLVMRESRVCGEEEGDMVVATAVVGFILWRRQQWAHSNGGPWGWPSHPQGPNK
jgi:hypothetical protein